MSRVGLNAPEDLNTTQFKNRIGGYENSNAGMVIYDITSGDSGNYSVSIKFTSSLPYEGAGELVVTPEAGS